MASSRMPTQNGYTIANENAVLDILTAKFRDTE
jgi:hypothetical protein